MLLEILMALHAALQCLLEAANNEMVTNGIEKIQERNYDGVSKEQKAATALKPPLPITRSAYGRTEEKL